MLRFFFALWCFLSSTTIFAGYLKTNEPDNPVVEQFSCITMAKAGSHLLTKLSDMFAQELGVEAEGYEGLMVWSHTSNISCRLLQRRLKLVLIRDPRDALVSAVDWVDVRCSRGYTSRHFAGRWSKLTYKQKVHTILYPVTKEELWVNEWIRIVTFFRNPANKIVRFEDIVGEKGGGSAEVQISTINAILDYLNIHFAQEKVEEFASTLWGDPSGRYVGQQTFNKGIIGRWTEHLNDPEIKSWVNDRLLDVMVEFGYVESADW